MNVQKRVYALPDKFVLDAITGPVVLVSDRGLSAFGERCTLLEGTNQPRGAEGVGVPGGRHLRSGIAFEREASLAEARGRVAFPPPSSGAAVEPIGPKASRSVGRHYEGGRSFAKFNPTALNSAASYASSNRHQGRQACGLAV